MVMREQDRHFLWSLYFGVGVIFVWKGIWESFYEIPYIDNPWVLLFIGLTMLTLSGIIFKEYDPLGNIDKSVAKMISFVHHHPHKEEFKIIYHDKEKKKDMVIGADKVRQVEKKYFVVKKEGEQKEGFIPSHRLVEIKHKDKTYWRL